MNESQSPEDQTQRPLENTLEVSGSLPHSLLELQAAREAMAYRLAETELQSTFSADHPTKAYFAVKSAIPDSYPSYEGQITASSLLSLEALGADTGAVLSELQSGRTNKREVTRATFGDSKLRVELEHQGLIYNLESIGSEENSDDIAPEATITSLIESRLLVSQAHKALREAAQDLISQTAVPSRVETKPFDFRQDPLGTVVFLSDIGLSSNSYLVYQQLSQGKSIDSLIDATLANTSPYTVVVSENEDTTTYTWMSYGRSIRKQLIIDKHSQSAVFSAEQQPITAYLEKANQSEARSLPFIETTCARELNSFLDEAGLMFHPKLQLEMVNMGDADRYGSIYTQMTREIAKWVDNPERFRLSELFVPANPEYSAARLAQGDTRPESILAAYENLLYEEESDPEAQARALYQLSQHRGETDAARVLFSMIDDVMRRDEADTTTVRTDLPVTKDAVSITNGACFDVAAYYVGAADEAAWRHPDALQQVEAHGVPLLEKTHGSHTFMNIEPIVFNGVKLPQGALLSRSSDGGWALLRLTPFAFEKTEDQLVFGSEISKMLQNEEETIRRIGEATLQTLLQATSR